MAPVDQCYQIKHSVGFHCTNDPADVDIVQKLLIANDMLPPLPVCFDMAAIIAAIKKFQAGFMLTPDGKISPTGTTFERLQGEGLVEMPASGGLGWYRYETGDDKKSRIMHFGTEQTVQAVKEVASAINAGSPGMTIGIGDLSTAMGTNLGRHQTHLNGKNVDIRPIRKDHAQDRTSISESTYSRDDTLLVVDSFLAHQNVDRILFNDPVIIQKRKPRVHSSPGHDNHLHVIMKN
jgi:hypothetical protein